MITPESFFLSKIKQVSTNCHHLWQAADASAKNQRLLATQTADRMSELQHKNEEDPHTHARTYYVVHSQNICVETSRNRPYK